jgi:hypothetical protein
VVVGRVEETAAGVPEAVDDRVGERASSREPAFI